MNWFDLLIILIVLLSTAAGVLRGFFRIGLGFVTTILAFILAAWFYGIVGEVIRPYVASKTISNALGFLSIFAAVMAAGALFTVFTAKVFRLSGLTWLDRLLGGAFGVARGLLLAIILVMIIAAFSTSLPAPIVGSRFAPYLVDASSFLAAMTPNEIKTGFRKTYDEVRKVWKDALRKNVKRLPRHEI